MEDRSVLVTGMTGHIGAALTAGLCTAEYRVRGAVRSRPQPGRLCQVVEHVEVGDIGPETDWTAALEGVAAIIHLAGRAHVPISRNDAVLSAYRHVNTLATKRLAEQAVEAGVRRFIFVSSALVNGSRTTASPFSEDDPAAANSPYAQSKFEAERALQHIARETALEIVIVRPPMVYGPRAKGNFLRLLNIVDRGVPLPLASIRNRRSIIGLSNLCHLLQRCLERPEAAGETFLAADDTLSTPELVRRTADALGRPARLWPCPPALLRLAGRLTGRQATIARLTDSLEVDDGKARRLLGWAPTTPMAEELARTVAWWRGLQTK